MISPSYSSEEDSDPATSEGSSTDSLSTSSDEEDDAEEEGFVEIDETKQKLAQMKRNNRGKGVINRQSSKLLAKFGKMLTPAQRAVKEQAERVERGLREVLSLHSPVELSSICGNLGCQTLLRGDESIELLVEYCRKDEDKETFSDYKVNRLCNNMWEGALLEYLKKVGHPQKGLQSDPKQAVMKMWRESGFTVKAPKAFTPHYIQRHVLTRHDAEQGADIISRTAKLKSAEAAMKRVERELFEEHDYTNALSYFQQLGAVRTMEKDFRDYMTAQLEIARSESSRAVSNAKLSSEMLEESEERYVTMVHTLQERAACVESAANHEFSRRFQNDADLACLLRTLRSYLAHQRGEREDVERIPNLHKASEPMRAVSNSLREFKSLVDHEVFKYQRSVRQHEEEIAALKGEVAELREQLEGQKKRGDEALSSLHRANQQVQRAARMIVMEREQSNAVRLAAWRSSARWAGRCHFLEGKMARLKRLVTTAASASHPTVVSMTRAVNNVLELLPRVALQEIYETARMEEEDKLSNDVRVEELRLKLLEEANAGKGKKKKLKKGKKGAKSSKGKGKASKGKAKAGGKSGKSPAKKSTAKKGAVKKTTAKGKAGKVSSVKKVKKK